MNNDSPKVSIILPTYNGSKYIRQSIESCLNQTYKNIELIIVDDASTDDTPGIIKSYSDHRIKYIRNERNQRLPATLNTGFSNATGEYLTWTSDDNQFLPGAIEEMLGFLMGKNAEFVYADYWASFWDTGEKEVRNLPNEMDLSKYNLIGPCFLYTRKVFKSVGFYDPKFELVEDYDYWIRCWNKFNLLHYPKPLYIYAEHSNSLKSTRQDMIVLVDGILRYRNKYITRPKLAGVFNVFYSHVRRKNSMKKSAFIYFDAFKRIWRISTLLAMLYFLSLIKYLAIGVINKLIIYPVLELKDYFKLAIICSRLNSDNSKQNILCVIPSMVIGGAEMVVLNIAEQLQNNNIRFYLVTTVKKENPWYGRFSKFFDKILITPNSTPDDNKYYRYLNKIINKLDIDILLISNSRAAYKCLKKLKSNIANLKVIDILHAEGFIGANKKYMRVTPYIDERVCISEKLKESMIKEYARQELGPEYSGKLQVIHNGIDLKKFSLSHPKGKFRARYGLANGEKIISYIGRFSPEKDPMMFVDIAEHITSYDLKEKIKFVMAGDGPIFNEIKAEIKRRRIEDNFLLTGMTDYVEDLLADTHILLIVSKSEGIPFTMLEAMAMNVPVISMNVGGVHEVIQNSVNGFIVDRQDNPVERCCFLIAELLSDETKYHEISLKTAEIISSEYSLRKMGESYKQVFNKLAKRG